MHTVITYKQIGGLAKQMQSRFREEQHQEIFLGPLSALLHLLVMDVPTKPVKKQENITDLNSRSRPPKGIEASKCLTVYTKLQ
jgi:hypothetical protein